MLKGHQRHLTTLGFCLCLSLADFHNSREPSETLISQNLQRTHSTTNTSTASPTSRSHGRHRLLRCFVTPAFAEGDGHPDDARRRRSPRHQKLRLSDGTLRLQAPHRWSLLHSQFFLFIDFIFERMISFALFIVFYFLQWNNMCV